jgi:hypothetical protein
MEAKMTQEKAVIDYLKSGKTLTTLEAMKELSIVDLGKVVSILRRKGHNITSTLKAGVNQYGKVRYSVYKLEEEK